jgi:hypothetical protein
VTVAFAFGFGIFLVLMAGLVVFVLRFAIRVGRRRPPASGPNQETGVDTGQGQGPG